MKNLKQFKVSDNVYVIFNKDKDYLSPQKNIFETFSFDTETIVIDKDTKELIDETALNNEILDKNKLECVVWCWSCFDEINGFFATNDYDLFMDYLARANNKFGWCFNAKFDFSQIDYKILKKHFNFSDNKKLKANEYKSLHSEYGARYQYEICREVKNLYDDDRHTYTTTIQFNDFANIITGTSLDKMLKSFGCSILKTTMKYQIDNIFNLTDKQIEYINNDVEGLYEAIKKLDTQMKSENDELVIFGGKPNVITAGGIAKRNLLKSMYESKKSNKDRIKCFQARYGITQEQDKYFRDNLGYRGGLCNCNKFYQGKLLRDRTIFKYDVNSEYPTMMYNFNGFDIGSKIETIQEKDINKYNTNDYYIFIFFNILQMKSKYKYFASIKNPITDEFDIDFLFDKTNYKMDKLFCLEKSEFDFLIKNYYDMVAYEIENIWVVKKSKTGVESLDYPFRNYVNKYYEKKRESKKDGNKVAELYYKILLNSSYGKLGENSTRGITHYEINDETGCVHLVNDTTLNGILCDDDEPILNVLMGGIITSMARQYILSKIIDVCKSDIDNNFIYMDTDSIMSYTEYKEADDYKLGALKLENTIDAFKVLAPKCYGYRDKDTKEISIHSKGISTKSIKVYANENNLSLSDIETLDKIYEYGKTFKTTMCNNVVGGKIILITEKTLAKTDLAPNIKLNNIAYNNGMYEEL